MENKNQPPYPVSHSPPGFVNGQGPPPTYQPYPGPTASQPSPAVIIPQATYVQQPVVITQPGRYHNTVVVSPTASTYGALPPNQARINCPSCREQITTRVDYKASPRTHMIAVLLCAVCLWCIVWLPYAMKSCKNANHYCPNCGAFIGSALNI